MKYKKIYKIKQKKNDRSGLLFHFRWTSVTSGYGWNHTRSNICNNWTLLSFRPLAFISRHRERNGGIVVNYSLNREWLHLVRNDIWEYLQPPIYSNGINLRIFNVSNVLRFTYKIFSLGMRMMYFFICGRVGKVFAWRKARPIKTTGTNYVFSSAFRYFHANHSLWNKTIIRTHMQTR